jgi:predicted 3-demethylubiquinone-9 3-methyltransferase (glyoxalase superfamily)
VECEDQKEIDDRWEKLSAGGEKSQCGWLKDKFGLSWQIVPKALGRMMQDPDATKTDRMMSVLLTMQKPDVCRLQAAFDGTPN